MTIETISTEYTQQGTELSRTDLDLDTGAVTVVKTPDHPDGAGTEAAPVMSGERLVRRQQDRLEDDALTKLGEISDDLQTSLQKFWNDPAFSRATGADFNFAAGEAVNLQPLVRMLNEVRSASIKSSQAVRIMIRRELKLAAEAQAQ